MISVVVVIVVIACSCSAITTCGCTIRRNHVDVGEKRLRLGKKGGGELVGGNVSLLRVRAPGWKMLVREDLEEC